tara:strand:- start:1445 stop:1681 length:237 start_codon:yes stop_codon:yes gene_type:complete
VFGERNFNVGDLVVCKSPVELTFDDYIVQPGEIGLVIKLMQYQDWLTGEYDYLVLIQGREVFFFDHELEPYESPRDTS